MCLKSSGVARAMVMVGQEEGVMGFPAREVRCDFDRAPFCVKKAARYAIVSSFPYTLCKF